MSGALVQIVAMGAQDTMLTSSPEITFFRTLYRRHTPFALEQIELVPQSASLSFGSRLVTVVSRNGDLLSRVWLEVAIKDPVNMQMPNHVWVSKFGHALLKSYEVEIGGSRIDRRYGRFVDIMHNLTCREEKLAGYRVMTGNCLSKHGLDIRTNSNEKAEDYQIRRFFIPINFFFTEGSMGSALPLIALQYHEVRITIEFEEAHNLLRKRVSSSVFQACTSGEAAGVTFAAVPRLWGTFVFLDTAERRRFSQSSHEYLITQIQYTGVEASKELSTTSTTPQNIRLAFNHPVSELFIVAEPVLTYGATTANGASVLGVPTDPFYNGYQHPGSLSSDIPDDNTPFESIGLQCNGHDRYTPRSGFYHHTVVPYTHHTRMPDHASPGLCVISFAINPEELQPSGTLNMSRIDTATLKLLYKPATSDCGAHTRSVYVFARNYNSLKCTSGMAGITFSN